MSEDLQSLLEKINRDGIEKAEAEAAGIVAAAKAKAAEIVKAAEESAAKAKAAAERAAADYEARAKESLAQAARDTVRKVESSVTGTLERLLAKDVDRSLADPAAVSALVAAALKDLVGPGEFVCGAQLAAAAKAQLAARGDFTVTLDEALGAGFSVRLDGGRVEHSFTGAVIAEELAKRLRPDLAALVK